jgi:hypothetical protein
MKRVKYQAEFKADAVKQVTDRRHGAVEVWPNVWVSRTRAACTPPAEAWITEHWARGRADWLRLCRVISPAVPPISGCVAQSMAKDVRSGLTVTDKGMACLARASRCGAKAVYRIADDFRSPSGICCWNLISLGRMPVVGRLAGARFVPLCRNDRFGEGRSES